MDNFIDNSDCFSSSHFVSPCSSASSAGDNSFATLSDTLDAQFCEVSKNFNVIHINAQSVPCHINDMRTYLCDKNLHAICVSETWLKPSLPSVSYSLPGFRLIRNDRTGSRGGGVAIYLRSHIPFSVINTSAQPPPFDAGEHLFIEITLSHTKILLGVYYCHSLHVNYFPSFEKLLENLMPLYKHSIIMGDLNTCLLKQDRRTYSLQSLTNSYNLQILPLNATHHFPNCIPSLLDLIIVSSPQHVAKHGQCSASFSYHDLIFISYKVRPPKSKPRIILQRNFSGMDKVAFESDVRNIDWSPVFGAESVNDQIALFNSYLIQLYDKHAPLRPIKIKHLPAPWLTSDIKLLMRKRDSAKFRFKCHPTEQTKASYVKARNRCNTACRDALRRHVHASVDNDDPAKVWKFLRTMGIGKSRLDGVPRDLDINLLNLHFSSSSIIDAQAKINTLFSLSNQTVSDNSSFNFSEFSTDEVKKSILSISSNAVGNDGISRNMLVPVLELFLPVLCVIFNTSISSGVFPSAWKDAQIIPLPKKPNPKSFSEYRPISILPFLSKVLERLVHNQFSRYLSRHNLINSLQSGFRSGHSTVSALVKITDDIRLSMENCNLTVLVLLDFSNAFNTVDHDVLLALLRSSNFSPSAINWFYSYLCGRRQRVRLEDNVSSWCSTSAGVPQGGVLSPPLFSFFINSISFNLSSSYHLYADDLQIYSHTPLSKISDAINTTNVDLASVYQWGKCFGLNVNPSKSQAIIIGSSRQISNIDWQSLPSIEFDGIVIPYSSSVRNLGIIMDRCMSWGPQLQETSRKLYAAAGALMKLRNFLPTSTKISLVQSLLLPILDYADVCYLDITEEQLNKLERLQNFCIRFIFGLRKYDHISEFRAKLKWLPIRLRRNAHILSLLYNVLYNPTFPSYLKERFNFCHETSRPRSLRAAVALNLTAPSHKTSFYGDSFTVMAVRLWNVLPASLRQSQSLSIFKGGLKDFYLSQSKTVDTSKL